MSIEIIAATDKVVLTDVVDKREKGKKALQAMLFDDSTTSLLTGEYLQADILTGQNGMAPFVEKDGKAIAIERLSGSSEIIECPSINLKSPLTCNDFLLKRQAGEMNMVTNGVDIYRDAAEKQIREDVLTTDDLVENRKEWMVAQLLQGSISYSVEGKSSFTIETQKPGGNTFTVADLWSTSDAKIFRDIKRAKRVVQPYSGPGFTAGICGQNASDALTDLLEAGTVKPIATDTGVAAGLASFIEEFQSNGMLYIGTFGGIPFFEYAGTYIKDDGTGDSAPFIRTDYVEFVTTQQPQLRKMYYGVIRDIEAVLAGMHIAKSFVNSDLDKDRGTYIAYHKTRPFPWFKRPEWYVSMKVT